MAGAGAGVNTRLGQGLLQDQLQAFTALALKNRYVAAILARAAELALPPWYLTAGCLFQTIWNVRHGHEPTHGIRDYDLFYFDDSDLSWEAEDLVVRRCARAFEDIPVKIEVRNQARVHLWYAEKFGVRCNAFAAVEDGIDSFLASSCCLGLRQVGHGIAVYAPHGLADLFNLVVRPNADRVCAQGALAAVYAAKAQRWQQVWPRVRILPWPCGAQPAVPDQESQTDPA